MAVRLNRALALPLRHDLSEAWRNTWNICSRSSSCCTCLQLHVKHSSKRNSGRSTYLGNHFSKANDFILGPKRYQQTLSSNFGAHLPSVKQIEHFLSSRKLRFEHGHTSLIASCPFCAKMEEAKEQTGELTLYINKTTGSHFCKGCGSSGTWQEFRTWCLEDHSPESSGKQTAQTQGHSENHADRTTEIWEKSYPLMKSSETVWERVIRQFSIQKLKADILERYKVQVAEHEFKEPDGKTKEHSCIVFPWYDANRAAVKGVKLIKLDDTSDASVTVEPRQGFVGLFGWNTVDPNAKEVVLTSTEFNALAVHQSTSYPAISLPLGTNSLPPEVLPQLEQFEKIIIWFGNDLFSRQAANQFSRKLNLKRCYLVRPSGDIPPANALDALNMGCDLNSLLSAAQPISHEKITTFHQLRGEVFDQFVNADQVAGVKWTRFPKMNSILKGLRRGEVTVFTGPTGAGKTTLLSEMSLDLCMQGVNTLWGSFEIRNVRLVKMMMCQYSGLNLENNVPQFQYWADKFEVLPMYFMCFYGAQNINTVIETMSHAAYVYDIEHVVVDNLQFMTSYLSRGDDRFSAQNHVISALRNFASTKNVHVTLVIHPRKENDDVELQTASIFGTAKASQEADNVIILQNKKGNVEKHLQVTKNRFDGVLGRVPLEFVRESLCMSGFGKTLQQKPPLNFNKKRPEKLKATRIVTDVGAVKFSAPKPFGQSNKLNNRNPRWPNPSSNTNIGRSNAEIKGTQISRESFDGNSSSRPNNAVKFEPKVKEDFLSTEKKETVQRTVKKILSGTRLFTKAVNASRSGQGRFERGQAVKKVQDTET